MINQLRKQGKLHEAALLAGLSIFSFFLSLFRIVYTDNIIYAFLNWNLFLAFVPWCISTLLVVKGGRAWSLSGLLPVWLLFFPNAPYILTDLFHLRNRVDMPLWFDLVLILSFAWTGLLFGLFSLRDIEKILRKYIKPVYASMISVILLFLSSYGVYVGRFMRWNSWDIIGQPQGLLKDIAKSMLRPEQYPGAIGMTLMLGILLVIFYISFRYLECRK